MERIGVLSPFLSNWYHGGILTGIARAAAQHDTSVIAVQTVVNLDSPTLAAASRDVDAGRAIEFNEPIAWSRVSGFVVIGAATSPGYLAALREAGKPIVMIGHALPGFDCPAVAPDNTGGTRAAVQHLLHHGHTRIGFAGYLQAEDVQERYDGFRLALTEHGIEPDPELCYPAADNSENGGRGVARHILAAGLPSTAVVAATDATAIGMIRGLAAGGCDLPRQQAIIGFGDIQEAAYALPRLASIRYSTMNSGATALAELIKVIRGEQPADSRDIHRLSTTLTIRESCGCGIHRVGTSTGDEATDLRRSLSDRLFATIVQLIATTVDQEMGKASTDLIARAVTGQSNPTDDEVNATLIQIAELTGRSAVLLDLADVIRGWTDTATAGTEAMLFRILHTHGRIKHNAAMSLMMEMSNQHAISTDLLRSHEEQPRELEWLSRTPTRHACLGLWSAGGPPSTKDPVAQERALLNIAGRFRTEDLPQLRALRQSTLADFPPRELIDRNNPRHGEIVSVIPVAFGSRDWGLLATVGPIRLEVIERNQESVNQNATLLTIALDEEEVLRELRMQERELRTAAMHDHLTGLPNRTLFLNRLSQAIHRATRETDHRFAVMFIDLDEFKKVNDSLGHPAGDEVLMQMAHRISAVLRPSDTAARVGGDEFLVLLDGFDHPDQPAQTAQRLESALARPCWFADREIEVTASVGVTVSTAGHRDADEVVRDADDAMYAAKSARHRPPR